jgi:mannose-6-phosphate isomerase-like protein (cupin superfamily)
MMDDCITRYEWGMGCQCTVLIDKEGLSIKCESMPPGTCEQIHFHQHQQQYFFILQGTATFYLDHQELSLDAYEGILVEAGQEHCIRNNNESRLEFLLITQPNIKGDRIDLPAA